jgi:hypothetical protein
MILSRSLIGVRARGPECHPVPAETAQAMDGRILGRHETGLERSRLQGGGSRIEGLYIYRRL